MLNISNKWYKGGVSEMGAIPNQIKDLFTDELNSKLTPDSVRIENEYSFSLTGIPIRIKIKIVQNIQTQRYASLQNHVINVAGQALVIPYEYDWVEDERTALKKTIDSLVDTYDKAIESGLTPEKSWLTPNPNYY